MTMPSDPFEDLLREVGAKLDEAAGDAPQAAPWQSGPDTGDFQDFFGGRTAPELFFDPEGKVRMNMPGTPLDNRTLVELGEWADAQTEHPFASRIYTLAALTMAVTVFMTTKPRPELIGEAMSQLTVAYPPWDVMTITVSSLYNLTSAEDSLFGLMVFLPAGVLKEMQEWIAQHDAFQTRDFNPTGNNGEPPTGFIPLDDVGFVKDPPPDEPPAPAAPVTP